MARRRARTKSASHAAEKARASAKKTTTGAKKKAPSSTSTPKARSASTTRSSSTKKRAAPKKRNTSSRKPSPVVLPELGVGERYFVLDIPFEMRSLASYYKAKYYKGYGHVFTGKQLPPPLKHFKSQDYTYERWVEDDLNGSVAPITMTKSKFVPRPHQQEALKKIFASAKHGYRGFIEADDVGLGKTLSCAYGAYGAAKIRKGKNILILCPKSVIPHWTNTLKSLPQEDGFRYCVLNYESSKKLLEPTF